ncbi:MAG: substrate-binding domain-containing protein [Eubacteriales bacterium]
MKLLDFMGQRGKRIAKVILMVVLFSVSVVLITYAAVVKVPSALTAVPTKIIVIGKTTSNLAFWLSLRDGVDVAAKEYGVDYEYWGPDSESDIDTQISLVYQAISEKPDAIILAATDYERLADPARAISDAGIPLITMDSNVYGDDGQIGSCFVATDNVAAGVKAGGAMQALLPAGKKVAIISHQIGTTSSRDRDTGVRQGLGGDIFVLPTADAAGSEDNAFDLASKILQDPDIGGIVCLNEYSTIGAARALIGAGLSGKVLLVGFDSSPSINTYLEEGCLNATVIQRPYNMGYVAMVNAIAVVGGKKVDPFYDTGSILVTKDTMYLEENEKLLFPFT